MKKLKKWLRLTMLEQRELRGLSLKDSLQVEDDRIYLTNLDAGQGGEFDSINIVFDE